MNDHEIVARLAAHNVRCTVRDGVCVEVSTLGSKMDTPFESRIRHNPEKVKIAELIAKLPHLRRVNLRKSRLGEMPEFVSHDLEYVDLSCNDLTSIPTSLYCQPLLRSLNLGANYISRVGRFYAPLEVLRLHKNPITHLSVLPKTIRELNIYMTGQDKIPATVFGMADLERLSFGVSSMVELPSLKCFPKLKGLLLAVCGITELPDDIVEMTNLEYLNLAKNNLRMLPEAIGNLTSLRTLSLYGNSVLNLPDSFYNLKLEKLSLVGNPLTDRQRVQDVFGGINYFRM